MEYLKKMSADKDDYRLPTAVKPTHYDLVIKTDLEKSDFLGVVMVSVDVKRTTSQITFNTIGLEISKVSIYSDSEHYVLHNLEFDEIQQRATCYLPSGCKLSEGSNAQLKILFAGKLGDDMVGYFKTSWVDKDEEGKGRYYALTQFAPTAARRCFPCWDEPHLKATFSLSMISRANTVNLANMPAIIDEIIPPDFVTMLDLDIEVSEALLPNLLNEEGTWKFTKFKKTPPMSTYIVAFANGEFNYLEDSVKMPRSGKTIPLRVYTTKDVVAQTRYTLEVKKVVLPVYEEVFDVEYPLPKLDTLVAHDVVGAVENWGLIIGSIDYLLTDPEQPSIRQKKAVAWMETHEIAHMWFGNIATMEWWNYIYLNEGFATLMGAVIIPNKTYPEWHANATFILQDFAKAMVPDAKLSSHPIEVDVPDANHVFEVFDALSYSKAASVLRMLSSYVGEDKFLRGVSIYLKKNLFGSTRTQDLWNGISEATGLDVAELMDNWVVKMGFPVLTVTEADNGKGIIVHQDRFLDNGKPDDHDNETIWNIPLSIITSQNGRPVVDNHALLREREKFFSFDTSKPFKLNAGTTGFYRVLYTPERLRQLGLEAAKKDSILSLDDKLGLLLDAMAVAKAGLASLSGALDFAKQLKDATEYPIWQGIADNLSSLVLDWWEHPDIVDGLNAFRRSLFVPLVDRLGYEYPEGEDADETMLRTLAVGQASAAGDVRVNAELRSRFKHYMETGDDSSVPADLQIDIFTAAVRYGGQAEYHHMVQIYNSSKTIQEKISALSGLSSPADQTLLDATFDFISTKARSPDILQLFLGLSKNLKARRLLTKYMQDHYDILYDRFQDSYLLSPLLSVAFNFYSSEVDLKAIEAFFKEKDASKYEKTVAQILDDIRARVGLIERSTEDLKQWLADM